MPVKVTSSVRAGTQKPSSEKTQKKSPVEPMMDTREQERNQRLNIAEGSLNAVTNGLTASFLVPFALVLGGSNTLIALLSTLPSLIGAFAQLGVQRVRHFFSTRRQHMWFFCFVQALLWLPLLFVAYLPHPGVWLLIIITANTIAGFLITPIWNSFTGDIVSEEQRGRFFGLRNTCTGIAAFFATLFAGLLLDWLKPGHPLLGFSILFGFAFITRLGGSFLFRRMGAPPEAQATDSTPEPQELLLHANRTAFGRFTLFLMIFHIAVNIASPFFTVYQLSILGFSYLQFTILACASAIASFITMLIWGRSVDRVGSRAVLMGCGLLIPLVPLGWVLTTDFWWLMGVEIFSGIVWAGFNLSVSTYLFDATDRAHRTRQVSEYTLLVQLAMFAGALLGSTIIDHYGKDLGSSYIHVFFLSAALRFIAILLFSKTITEQRMVEIPVKGRLFKHFVAIKPQQGIVYQPSVESTGVANRYARENPRDIRDQLSRISERAQRVRSPDTVKKMERAEYEQDFAEYKKKLRK